MNGAWSSVLLPSVFLLVTYCSGQECIPGISSEINPSNQLPSEGQNCTRHCTAIAVRLLICFFRCSVVLARANTKLSHASIQSDKFNSYSVVSD